MNTKSSVRSWCFLAFTLFSCSAPDPGELEAGDLDVAQDSVLVPNRDALLVVGGAATVADGMVASQLRALGFSVTMKMDTDSRTTDAAGKRLVVISSSVAAARVAQKFRNVAVPVLIWEPALFDDMGLTAANAYGTRSQQTQLVMKVNSKDQMAPGIAGKPIVSASSTFTWGTPHSSAKIVATTLAGKPAIFRYSAAATLFGLKAPARRVAFFMGDSTAASLTRDGSTLLAGAISWAAGLPRLNDAGCATNAECESGMCHNAVCTGIPNNGLCSIDADCDSSVCLAGSCQTASACSADSDCSMGLACLGGLCTERTCDANAACPVGHVCSAGKCVSQCATDSDCALGSRCVASSCTNVTTEAVCGDGAITSPETCDDGNNTSGDGCRSNCTIERCGDAIQDASETCDDGNNASGDGCSSTCQKEA